MKTTILFATLGVTLSLTSCKKEEVNLNAAIKDGCAEIEIYIPYFDRI